MQEAPLLHAVVGCPFYSCLPLFKTRREDHDHSVSVSELLGDASSSLIAIYFDLISGCLTTPDSYFVQIILWELIMNRVGEKDTYTCPSLLMRTHCRPRILFPTTFTSIVSVVSISSSLPFSHLNYFQ